MNFDQHFVAGALGLNQKVESHCRHCNRQLNPVRQVLADGKLYCGRLCAAIGLIRDTDDADGIDEDTGIDAIKELVEECFRRDKPIRVPTRIRDSDTEAALELLDFNAAMMVVIEDTGTPDWIPPEPYNVQQSHIDRIVNGLLGNA